MRHRKINTPRESTTTMRAANTHSLMVAPLCKRVECGALWVCAFLLLLLLLVPLLPSSGAAHFPAHLGADCPAPTSNHTIRVGVFLCPSTSVIACPIPRIDLIVGMWVTHVNQEMCGLLGYPVHLVSYDLSSSAANASEILAGAMSLSRRGAQFVILPSGSLWGPAMSFLENQQIPAVAPLSPSSSLYQCTTANMASGNQPECTRPNTRRFQFVHSILSPAEKYLQAWVGLLQLKRCSSLAMVSTSLQSYVSIIAGLTIAAADNHIPIIGQFLSLPVVTGSNSVSLDTVITIVDELRDLNADAVVILASDCRPWIVRLQEVNYLPKSLATLLCTDSLVASQSLGDALNYIVGPVQWDSHLKGSEYTETNATTPWSMFIDDSATDDEADLDAVDAVASDVSTDSSVSSPLQFVRRYQSTFNLTTDVIPGYDSGAILAALAMLHGAIVTAGTFERVAVNTALQLYYSPSFYGLLTTDRYGMNQQKQLALLQRDSQRDLHTIFPSQAATLDFIYPMPTWDDRVYSHRMFDLPLERAFIGLIVACTLFTLGLCAYLFYHRSNQIFQAAGVQFYMLMGFGCILSYFAILTWSVENSPATCHLRVWAWTIAFHMFVGPMVSCALRIARIYTQGLQSVRVSNRKVAFYCLLFYLPQLILNILWTSLDPLRPTVVVLDPIRPKYNYTVCESDNRNGATVFAVLTLVYSAMMLLTACYLAWRVRRAYSIFNDAKPIALSMYIFTLVSMIVVVVQLSLNSPDFNSQKVVFAVRSAGVLLAYQGSLSILFLRRILDQLDLRGIGGELQTAIMGGPGLSFGDSPHLKTEISDALARIQKQNDNLPECVADGHVYPIPATPLGNVVLVQPRSLDVGADHLGLFSRGGESSVPSTPIFKPFGGRTAVIHGPHINNTQHNTQYANAIAQQRPPNMDVGDEIRLAPPAYQTIELVKAPATITITPRPSKSKPARGMPGQALTHSALAEENSSDDDSHAAAAAIAVPPLLSVSPVSPSTPPPDPPTAPPHIQTPTPAAMRRLKPKHQQAMTPTPHAPLPSEAELRAMQPTQFYAWREQVRHELAMLALQLVTQQKHTNTIPTAPAASPDASSRAHPILPAKVPSPSPSPSPAAVRASEELQFSATLPRTSPTLVPASPFTATHPFDDTSSVELVAMLRHAAVVSHASDRDRDCHGETSLTHTMAAHTLDAGMASTNGVRPIFTFTRSGSKDDDTNGTQSPEPNHPIEVEHDADSGAIAMPVYLRPISLDSLPVSPSFDSLAAGAGGVLPKNSLRLLSSSVGGGGGGGSTGSGSVSMLATTNSSASSLSSASHPPTTNPQPTRTATIHIQMGAR